MNSKDNSTPFENMETDKKELYKKTPLKKRPIQQSSLPPDEKKISQRPRSSTAPEFVRRSKRKIRKPTKRIIDSYAESAEDLEPAPMEVVCAPVIKTPAEDKVSSPVQVNSEAATAIPVLETTCGEKKVPSRTPKISRALYEKNLTKQEWEDFNLAIELQKEEFNLRKRRPTRTTLDVQIEVKRARQPVKTKRTRAVRKKRSSPKTPQKTGKKKGTQRRKRTPKRTSKKTRRNAPVASTDLFAGDSMQMYIVSPALANILGQEKLPSYAINTAINYIFLERNLFEKDRKYVTCDDELSKQLFAGKRRLRFVDAKKRLYKHFTLSD